MITALDPVVVENVESSIREIIDRDIPVLIADSNASHLPEIVDSGDPESLPSDEEIQMSMQGGGE